jgi:two-component system, sensor histidine kinase PdtaS
MVDISRQDSGRSDIEKVRAHIRILVDIGRIAGEAANLDDFLDQAVVQVARAVEIDHAKILRYRPDTGDFLVAAGIGWKAGVVRTATLPADLGSAPGRAFRIAETVVVQNFEEQSEYMLSSFLKHHGIVSLANAPLLAGTLVWGVLEVDSTVPRDFSQDTCDFLIAAGSAIGACVRRLDVEPGQNERLTAAVLEAQHRETLLREMQHRVKNSFQLILASITLQKRRYGAGDVQSALDHVAERINAISLAHDQLAPRDGGQVVKVSDYLRALCYSIRQQIEGVEIDVEADEVELSVDRAVALGLILNEAATNSVKHAFGEQGGRIGVTLQSGLGYGEAKLTVTDNGRGMPAVQSGQGSGLKLIDALGRKIGAKIDRHSSAQGTTIAVQFPIIM